MANYCISCWIGFYFYIQSFSYWLWIFAIVIFINPAHFDGFSCN
ncbi:hypothetical protein CIT292_07906 [Citrobacter youngae ATCC 29220]|uniref:Uncharacterized protein n=1 Tax=Citrobacter youngae ATCC 29220 TaxID=500640 RepID=D4BBW6_9ENTR|nr:hypothetical protein CIT292_07906 [Citrobacter youngae ATCC 29220]